MNYTKVVTHKKRTVVPIFNIEVRGRLNLLFAMLGALVVLLIILLFNIYLAFACSISTFVGLLIYLNELDDESNSVIYKKYVEIVHKSGVSNICWFDDEKSRITTRKKQSCNLININNYKGGMEDVWIGIR